LLLNFQLSIGLRIPSFERWNPLIVGSNLTGFKPVRFKLIGLTSGVLLSAMASLLIVIVGVMDKKEANFEDLYSSGQKGGCFF